MAGVQLKSLKLVFLDMQAPEIPKVRLGGAGPEVSRLAFGTYRLAHNIDPVEGMKMIKRAYDSGINLIDTSDNYGYAEMAVGRALKEYGIPRDKIVIATKTGLPRNQYDLSKFGEREADLSAERIRENVEKSLILLQTDYIDLYQAHAFDKYTPEWAFVLTMNNLIEEGKIRHYGVSNFDEWGIRNVMKACKDMCVKHLPVSYQPFFNLIPYGNDSDVELARQSGMSVLAYSPLGGGRLTRDGLKKSLQRLSVYKSMKSEMEEAGSFDKYPKRDDLDRAIAEGEMFAKFHGLDNSLEDTPRNIQQLSVAWLIRKGTIPILGANTPAQLDELLVGAEWKLDDALLAKIDATRLEAAKTLEG